MYDWAEFRHFRYLLKILEKRGFRLAAEELFTSQPNLTVQARQFQDNASVRLFHKSKSGQILPTKAGIAFVVLARNLLEYRDEVIDAVVAIERNEISAIRLGSTPLQGYLTIFYHPQRHPEAHKRLLELLGDAEIFVEEFSRASHPSEIQSLVREGHSLALVREGTPLLGEQITRPIVGVDWTVDTAIIYRKDTYPRNIPALVRTLKRQIMKSDRKSAISLVVQAQNAATKRAVEQAEETPVQLSFSEEIV